MAASADDLDRRARLERDEAAAAPALARVDTDFVSARQRTNFITDELASRLTSGRARPLEGCLQPPGVQWLNVDLGGGLVLARGHGAGLDIERDSRLLRDGDDDCSLFVSLSDGLRFEQNDRRVTLSCGDGIFVAHARPVRSFWADNQFLVVRLPRHALGHGARVDQAGGTWVPAGSETMMLVRPYIDALMRRGEAGQAASSMARRQIAELVGRVATGGLNEASPSQLGDARFAAIQAAIEANYTDPGFSMAHAAAAARVSPRTGYVLCAERGMDFMHAVRGVRLDRAMERLSGTGSNGPRILQVALAVGFSDLSHFNRLFRARFGCTPSEARLR